MMITDWQMNVKVAGEPYGNGAFVINYIKHVGKVDAAIFISELRKQLEEKYGKARFERTAMQMLHKIYLVCWGNHCSEIKQKDYVGEGDASLPKGKYLLVSFSLTAFPPSVIFSMFDTSPYHLQKIEWERRAAEAARKKIKF